MKDIRFEWDPKKATQNFRKHRVRFEEAATVFIDEYATEYDDPDHSENEERFLMLGMSRSLRVLIVSYCLRQDDSVIRIISARRADKLETQAYFRRH